MDDVHVGRRNILKIGSCLLGALTISPLRSLASASPFQFPTPSLTYSDNISADIEVYVTKGIDYIYDLNNNLFNLNIRQNLLSKYSPDGTLLWRFGGSRKLLNCPSSIAMGNSGSMFVADKGNSRILKLSNRGKLAFVIKHKQKPRRLYHPNELSVANNNLYIADTHNNQILIYTLAGHLLKVFGSFGLKESQFNHPSSIAVSEAGEIFVVDKGNRSVKVFSKSGVLLDVFNGSTIAGLPTNFQPSRLALSKEGLLYVVERVPARVLVFTQFGRIVDRIDLISSDNTRPQPNYISFKSEGTVILSAHHVLPAITQR